LSSIASAKKAVREILGKSLRMEGFMSFGDRTFLRRRGDILDGVGVQFGRGAESFYLHYFIKLVADPVNDNPSAYRIGTRLQASEAGANDWVVEGEISVQEVFRRLTATAIEVAIPYFESVSSIRDYVVEVACDVNYRARLTNFDLAIAMAALGRINKVIQLCEETMQAVSQANSLPEEERKRIYTYAAELRSAATQGHLIKVLEQWKGVAIKKLGLAE
jgi:hypothetical protein